jgi:hypothetical protein
MNTEIIDAGRDISGGYKVDVSRGTNVDRVSSEWFSRPDDERYLSLDDIFASVKGRAERSRTRTVESAAIRVEAHRDNPEKLGLVLPGADEPIAPTHWSFGQLSSLVGAPAAYAAAKAKGKERYGGFVQTLARRLAKGSTLTKELSQDVSASTE